MHVAFRVDLDALIAYREEQLVYQLSESQKAAIPGLAAEALELAEELGIQTTLASLMEPENLSRGDREIEIPEDQTGFKGAPCLKAWHYLVVQADGKTSPCCVLAGEGEAIGETPLETLWKESKFLNRVREGMLNGKPLDRCRECSGNILAHEALIRGQI